MPTTLVCALTHELLKDLTIIDNPFLTLTKIDNLSLK